jgi:hypothetical protein
MEGSKKSKTKSKYGESRSYCHVKSDLKINAISSASAIPKWNVSHDVTLLGNTQVGNEGIYPGFSVTARKSEVIMKKEYKLEGEITLKNIGNTVTDGLFIRGEVTSKGLEIPIDFNVNMKNVTMIHVEESSTYRFVILIPDGTNMTEVFRVGLIVSVNNGFPKNETEVFVMAKFNESSNIELPKATISFHLDIDNRFSVNELSEIELENSDSAQTEYYWLKINNVSALPDTYTSFSHFVTIKYGNQSESTKPIKITISTPPYPKSQVLSLEYWKAHTGGIQLNPDRITELLPIYLGSIDGSKSRKIISSGQCGYILSGYRSSNSITKLSALLLTTKLNVKKGCKSNSELSNEMNQMDTFLSSKDENSVLDTFDIAKINKWSNLLLSYLS